MEIEYLEIPSCPKCGLKHRYKLEVERATIIQYGVPSQMNEQPRSVRFTRLFTCPEKNDNFQVKFILQERSYDRIVSATVIGHIDYDE
jgi:hypothetical protein